MEWI
jgi:hypothetical protein